MVLLEAWMTVVDPFDVVKFSRSLERALHKQDLENRCCEATESVSEKQVYSTVGMCFEEMLR